MITSIVLKGMYKLPINQSNKIKIADNILSVEKDIPFVRYRFNEYTDEQFNYIKSIKNSFKYSTHLAEIKLSENTLAIMNTLMTELNDMAKYVYIELTNENVQNCSVGETNTAILSGLAGIVNSIDRIMFKDNTTNLDMVTAKKIIKQCCQLLNTTEDKFGICSSPLSFSEMACLTAVKARELMSKYSPIADVALPSANHQCMNCCGCIRYLEVNEDISVLEDKVSKKASSNPNETTSSKPKTPKTTVSFGLNSL